MTQHHKNMTNKYESTSTIDEIIRETFQDGSYLIYYYHNDITLKIETYNKDSTLVMTEVYLEDGSKKLFMGTTPYQKLVESLKDPIKDPSLIIEVSMQDIAYVMGVPVNQLRIIHE